jgi:hypothetical protein
MAECASKLNGHIPVVIVWKLGGNGVERRLPPRKRIRASPSDMLYDPAWDRDFACCPGLNSWLSALLGESAVSRMLVTICVCVFSIWMQVAGWDRGQQADGLHTLSKLTMANKNHDEEVGHCWEKALSTFCSLRCGKL